MKIYVFFLSKKKKPLRPPDNSQLPTCSLQVEAERTRANLRFVIGEAELTVL